MMIFLEKYLAKKKAEIKEQQELEVGGGGNPSLDHKFFGIVQQRLIDMAQSINPQDVKLWTGPCNGVLNLTFPCFTVGVGLWIDNSGEITDSIPPDS